MKRFITLLLCISCSVSLIAQNIVGTWQADAIVDSSNGINIATQISFKPDGFLELIRVFYNNDASFAFVANGKYNLADNHLFIDYQNSGSGFKVDNQYISPTNNWIQLVGNGIDVYEISSASAGYIKTLPQVTQVLQLTDDYLETSEWKLKRYVDPAIAAAEKAEAERVAAEKAAEEQQLASEKAEAERIAAEKAEAERLAAEKAEAERLEAERAAEEQRLATEKAEAERIAAEKAEAERIAAEKAEADRLAAEKAEAERLEAAKVAEEQRLAAEKAEADRLAAEKTKEVQTSTQSNYSETSQPSTTGNTIIRKGSKLLLADTGVPITATDLGNQDLWDLYSKGSNLMNTGKYLYIAGGVSLAIGGGCLAAMAAAKDDSAYTGAMIGTVAGLAIAPICAVTGVILRLNGKSKLESVVSKKNNGVASSTISFGAQPNGIGLAYKF